MAILGWGPPYQGIECKGYEKITIFDIYLALSLTSVLALLINCDSLITTLQLHNVYVGVA